MQFQPTDQGVAFTVPAGVSLFLGRQPRFQLINTRISRRHAELTVQQQGSSITCTCLAHKKVEVQRGSELYAVQAGQQLQLLPGDILFLVREGTKLTAGFRIAPATSSSTTTPQSKRKSHAKAPSSASKRRKLDTTPTAAAAAAAGDHQDVYQQHLLQQAAAAAATVQPAAANIRSCNQLASGTGGAVAAAAAAGDHHQCVQQQQQHLSRQAAAAAQLDTINSALGSRLDSGNGGLAEQLQVFAGVRICMWDQHHTHRAAQLAARAGGEVQTDLDGSTTHVVAPFGLTLEQLQQHLQTHSDRQQQQQQQQQQYATEIAAAPDQAAPTSTAMAGTAAAAAAGSPVAAAGGEHARASQHAVRRLRFEHQGSLTQCLEEPCDHAAGQQQQQQRSVDVATMLPAGVQFVTVRWLTDSFTAGKLLPEAPYYIHLQRCQHQPSCSEVATQQVALQQAAEHSAAAAPAAAAAEGTTVIAAAAAELSTAVPMLTVLQHNTCTTVIPAAAAAASQRVLPDSEEQWGQQVAGVPAGQQQQRGQQCSNHSESAAAGVTLRQEGDELPTNNMLSSTSNRAGSGASAALTHSQQQQQQQQQQAGTAATLFRCTDEHHQQTELATAAAVHPTQQHQQQYRGLVLPQPDQICRPGEPWGTAGRWFEPWKDEAAADAVEQLLAHWHGYAYKRKQIRPLAPAAAAGAAAVGEAGAVQAPSDGEAEHGSPLSGDTGADADDATPHQQLHPETTSAAAATVRHINPVCAHIACSQQRFCFVQEMDRVRGTYSKGRRDEFRIRAAERAIRALQLLPTAITSQEDIRAMRLGPKTSEKLQELLNTGHVQRTEVLEGSEYNKIMALFNSVWGVAESTAERWYQAGCRTLQDVKAKVPNLTAMQQVGLKYYEDFLQRIPRVEVAECEAIVTEATADTLLELSGKPRSAVTHLLHCRALGSYVRGKPECGDVDFIIAPGPACSGVGLGPLMAGVLQRLTEQGYVTQDMLPLEHRKAMRGSDGRVSWMGVYKGPTSPCYRRLDIKLYPRCQLATAVNYFASGQAMCRALRHWCNRPNAATSALAAALNPAGNAFRLSDRELVVIHNAFARKARKLGQGGDAGVTAAAAEAAVGSDRELSDDAMSGRRESGMHITASVKQGNSRMALRGKSRTICETVVGPAIKCECETAIFRALGLAYVPMHMRNLLSS